MAQSTKNSSDQPSLRELLRFKKAERPGEAFWERFDHELHHRMMQTLVKKDPWYVQVMRGLSGRIAQATATFGAACFLTFMVVGPAMNSKERFEGRTHAQAEQAMTEPSANAELTEPKFAQADYQIDVVSKADLKSGIGVSEEYHMDSIQVASYDAEVYTIDSAFSGVLEFASTGVALAY
tara:strand:+ start:868 stop:1407 length:540 start_codon:yes stop_codon:yes gene_type:complete